MTFSITTFAFVLLFLTGSPEDLPAQDNSLALQITNISKTIKGDVGVSMKHLDNGDTLSVLGKMKFPMQSVYKFALALAVFHQVDEGKLSLEQQIPIKKEAFIPNTWSPLAKAYPEGGVNIPLREILRYTVSMSDNNGCDLLFSLVGGPIVVDQYIQSIGINDMVIRNTEAEMHQHSDLQFKNWSTPIAMTKLLEIFHTKDILSKSSHDILWEMMAQNITGTKRIRGHLPEGTIVADRTGTGAKNDAGIWSAVNCVGIIRLPDGKDVALSVFITNAEGDFDAVQQVIAKVAKTVYDHYALEEK